MKNASALALILSAGSIGFAPVSAAQEAPAATPNDVIVVTGSRSPGRLALEASAPISVVTADDLQSRGFGDLSRSLQYLEPSLNYPRSATTATSANSRALTLRGLSPDQTLILINGKRRHATSILNINNAVGRGAAGVDLDLLPTAAVERIEVLRDGAAAQYGSDAIAGVVNLVLRDDAEGGFAFAQAGVTGDGDGANALLGGWWGLRLPNDGRLTVSGEARTQEPTNRANVDRRLGRVTYQFGDPEMHIASLALNASLPLGHGEAYGFATLSRKDSTNPAGFRLPTFAPAVFPNGFLPKINPVITDFGAAVGWRSEPLAGWLIDAGYAFGFNEAAFAVTETVNASLGAASPTRFDAGSVRYEQGVLDLTASRPLTLFAGGNLAFGLQHRHESYESARGEPNATFGAGADGFAGFTGFSGERDARAAFVDLEVEPTERVLLTAALRFDDYDDFGEATTWRTSARFAVTDSLAVRGSLGTGFRAPSLQQQQFRLASGALSGAGVLTNVGTLPVSDPVARLLGAQPLRPEDSRNAGFGAVFNTGAFTLTADWFRIEIDDRIVLSEQFGGAAVRALLTTAGVTNFQEVRFFTNAVDTTTEGVEIAARYQVDLPANGRLNLGIAYANAETTIDLLRPNPVLPTAPYLLTRSRLLLDSAQPEHRARFEANYERGPLSLQANVSYFGPYSSAGLGNAFPQKWGEKTVVDLSGRYMLGDRFTIGAGVQNVGDVLPDQFSFNDVPAIIAATGSSFPTGEESPIGVNGRTFFVRLETRF